MWVRVSVPKIRMIFPTLIISVGERVILHGLMIRKIALTFSSCKVGQASVK